MQLPWLDDLQRPTRTGACHRCQPPQKRRYCSRLREACISDFLELPGLWVAPSSRLVDAFKIKTHAADPFSVCCLPFIQPDSPLFRPLT